MILTFLLLSLVFLISYPIIGFKVIKAFREKDKRKLHRNSALLLILFLVSGFYWRLLPGSDFVWIPIEKIREKNYNFETTGYKFNKGKSIYISESVRAFNGDGYSIWIYEIDNSTASYFKNPNDAFFSKHPRTELRSHWESEFWKKTPFDQAEQMFLDFAYSSLDDLEFELDDILNEEGNYYGYEYFMHDFNDSTAYVGDIDFYVICPKRKIIVIINHNT